MNKSKYVFAQLIEFLDSDKFRHLVDKYDGNRYVQQFHQACPCHVGQFYLRLARSHCRLVALGNVLLARACRLHHLVNGAVALGQETVGEVVCDVVDDLRNLIDPQIPVMPMLRQKRVGRLRIRSGLITLITLITLPALPVWLILIVHNNTAFVLHKDTNKRVK